MHNATQLHAVIFLEKDVTDLKKKYPLDTHDSLAYFVGILSFFNLGNSNASKHFQLDSGSTVCIDVKCAWDEEVAEIIAD